MAPTVVLVTHPICTHSASTEYPYAPSTDPAAQLLAPPRRFIACIGMNSVLIQHRLDARRRLLATVARLKVMTDASHQYFRLDQNDAGASLWSSSPASLALTTVNSAQQHLNLLPSTLEHHVQRVDAGVSV